ncbi:MAG: hypothetical protein RMK52_02745 [Chitinophagales bacterium]|nr:hypothetical protein [Chitinophagales bacterium]MDW8393141.1 hypothetical protein [Chitinophagales bacterium]
MGWVVGAHSAWNVRIWAQQALLGKLERVTSLARKGFNNKAGQQGVKAIMGAAKMNFFVKIFLQLLVFMHNTPYRV